MTTGRWNHMYKKSALYFILFVLCLTSVFAANTATFHFYDKNGNPVNYVEVSVFECTDSSCSEVDASKVEYYDTGASNDAVLNIPKVSSTTWFVAYAFAEESDSYLPEYQTFYATGNNGKLEADIELNKKDICRSTIQSFSVTNSVASNEPVYVDVEAALEADTYGAFQYADANVYAYGDKSSTYGEWFKAETEVELTIFKQLSLSGQFSEGEVMKIPVYLKIPVYSDSETINIQAGESENVQFSWTPSIEGEYVATVTSYVIDDQCASAEEQSSEQEFEVVSEEDVEYCYTLVDNLAVQEIEEGTVSELQVGEIYTVIFDKLSNEVDNDGNLIPTDTALDVTIYDDTNAVTYAFSAVSGNANIDYAEYSFEWTPVMEGDNTIEVYGIADNCSYSENNDESESLTIYVAGEDETLYLPVADADGSQLFGFAFSDTPTYDVDFDGSRSYDTNPDGSGYIVSYAWNFGDGSTSTEISPTHTFTGTGPFTVTLTVTDNDGLTDSDALTVRRFHVEFPDFDFDPSADCGGKYSATLGDSIAFDGTGSEFGGGAVTFVWDFGDGGTSTEEDPTYTYSAEGTYTVTLIVTDDEGDTAEDSCTATITAVTVNDAPEVDCTVLPTSGTTKQEVTLDVDATDSDGTIVKYDWEFGDGSIDSTTTDSNVYIYTTAGTYAIIVTVTDDVGATGSCSQAITITDETAANQAPTADCSLLPTSAEVFEEITFDGSGSTDSDGTIVNYEWDFGYIDNSGNSMIVSGPTISTTKFGYAEAGTYTVTLTVTDDDSATDSCSQDITVTEVTVEDKPAIAVASANPTSGEPTLWVQFSSDGSSGNEPLNYYWTFGDGESSTRVDPDHYYDEEGTYTATLTITDADGDSDSDSVTITVSDELENIASRHYYVDGIAISKDGIVNAGDTLELYISAENIADMDKNHVAFNAIIQELGMYATTVEFNLNAGEQTAAVLYLEIPGGTRPGSYYVRVTISDDDVKRVIYRDIVVQ